MGLAAVEIGKAMGAIVIAAASSDEKLEVCKQHGADEVINYSTEDLRDRIKQLTGGKGVDVAFDPLGGDYSEPVLRSMAWGGRFLVIGFASGDIPSDPTQSATTQSLLDRRSVLGFFYGTRSQTRPGKYSRTDHMDE